MVVGTRSAVFAPLHQPGLIIVDEEHDGSYKQEESPRYNGRDVAVMRGRQAGALVVLGSATPSLESYHNALSGRYTLLTLEKRVLDRPLADVRIVDMREEYAAGGPDVILSSAAVRVAGGAPGDPASRRSCCSTGAALRPRWCAASAARRIECPNCSLSLTVHRAARRARCHYCNYAIPVPRAVRQVRRRVPRTDRLRHRAGRGGDPRALSRGAGGPGRPRHHPAARRDRLAAGPLRGGELDILVGTQMLAKGHDFPNVTLVGVISADVGLGLADFRAGERTFQLLTQVAGRAGRGEVRGEAIVQTLFPTHYSIRHACRQDYVRVLPRGDSGSAQSMRYPPAIGLINVVVRARSLDAAMQDATEIARILRADGSRFRVLGPAPAPLSRLQGRAPRPVLPEGDQPRHDAPRAAEPRSPAAPNWPAEPPSTSIRSACCRGSSSARCPGRPDFQVGRDAGLRHRGLA